MDITRVILFGFGKFGSVIVERLKLEDFVDVVVVETDVKKRLKAVENGFNCLLIDITDDEHLKSLPATSDHKFVCAMDDDHSNVYLTLSLKDIYPDNQVLAISDSMYVTEKLKLAGADKIVDLYAISANRIYNILNKSVVTKFLEGIIYKKHKYSFKEIVIPKGSFLDGKMLDEINFKEFNIILIGLIDIELSDSFDFITTGRNHKLDYDDVLVFLGRDEDLERFEKALKG
jgi:voltage-gated potassium channel